MVCAQNSETVYPVSYEHLNVAPAESWMFMKYGPSKPSLYTGTVRADIPLYTYRDAYRGIAARRCLHALLRRRGYVHGSR